MRQERWGPRLIDIDILVFGDRTVHENGLEIPHPRMLERAFVLAPLAEIAPDFVAGGRPLSDHLADIDTTGIERQPSGRDWWKAVGQVSPRNRRRRERPFPPAVVSRPSAGLRCGKTSEPLDDVAVLDSIAHVVIGT